MNQKWRLTNKLIDGWYIVLNWFWLTLGNGFADILSYLEIYLKRQQQFQISRIEATVVYVGVPSELAMLELDVK